MPSSSSAPQPPPGAAIGVAAAMAGGWADRIVTGLFDAVSAFPPLILAFGLIALYGSGPLVFVALATVVFIPQFGRVARARAQSPRDQSFVEAERLLGLHPARIVARHVLPNVAAPVLVVATLGSTVLGEALHRHGRCFSHQHGPRLPGRPR